MMWQLASLLEKNLNLGATIENQTSAEHKWVATCNHLHQLHFFSTCYTKKAINEHFLSPRNSYHFFFFFHFLILTSILQLKWQYKFFNTKLNSNINLNIHFKKKKSASQINLVIYRHSCINIDSKKKNNLQNHMHENFSFNHFFVKISTYLFNFNNMLAYKLLHIHYII